MTRVLIVDDNTNNLYYLTALLRAHDFEVVSAVHGAEALVRARNHPPQLIISDLLMPVMDGYTLLRHWRADSALQAIPFVVFTATYTEPEDEQLAFSLGADAFILKPCEPDEFLAKIHAVLAGERVSVDGRRAPEDESQHVLEVYSRALIRKLEEKSLQLETSNESLRREIEERKHTEEVLRESEARFRQLAENIDEVFWVTTVDKMTMLYVSPAYERIWGRSCQELYASPEVWADSLHPDDADEVRRAASTEQTLGEYDQRYRIIRPDGEVRWIRDRAFPVRDETGTIFRVVGIAEDITERLRIENQLLRSQRMQSLGTLAGGIAHDLNNALTPILMSIDLLRETDRDAERLSILDHVEQSARQGADMVRQVLTFARGVEGRRIAVAVPSIVSDVQKVANDTFLKSILVKTSIADSLPLILGDPTQVHQVLLNLCVNARDAMPNGGAMTIVADSVVIDEQTALLESDAKAGAYVRVCVEDSGEGMAPSVVERIFEPFFTTKPLGKGTGLGLSTSLAIVRSHGGFMRVHSERGKGSAFSMLLPAYQGAARASDDAEASPSPRGQQQLVLVVDDESLVREMTRRTLEAFGYRVLVASDGAEAIAQLEQQQSAIALIIVDMMMPIMDGPTLVRSLRASNVRTPIVAVSGLADTDEFRNLDTLELSRVLAKPFTAELLLTTVAEVLSASTVE